MNKPKTIEEAISRARTYGTPTYMMLADGMEALEKDIQSLDFNHRQRLAEAEEENTTLGTQAYNMEERVFQAEAREKELRKMLNRHHSPEYINARLKAIGK